MQETIERARAAFAEHAWEDAYRGLSEADGDGALEPGDLERLSTAAYLTGRPDEFLVALERAHHAWLDSGDCPVRPAPHSGSASISFLPGRNGPATGWFGRARRLLGQSGEGRSKRATCSSPPPKGSWVPASLPPPPPPPPRPQATGERFGDADLTAMARHVEGRALVRAGRVEAGLALLDEAMVAVTSGELSPIVTGLVYCSVIEACQEVYAVERAGEWTAAMARWCGDQPQMGAFTGICLVRRAEILQLRGSWPDALAEAERACLRYAEGKDERPPQPPTTSRRKLHRLRGEFSDAEKAYREASRWGCEPQPGLALLRLAEGRMDAATAAIRRAVGNAKDRPEAARLLPARSRSSSGGRIRKARARPRTR